VTEWSAEHPLLISHNRRPSCPPNGSTVHLHASFTYHKRRGAAVAALNNALAEAICNCRDAVAPNVA
jgi:hypothetical protein